MVVVVTGAAYRYAVGLAQLLHVPVPFENSMPRRLLRKFSSLLLGAGESLQSPELQLRCSLLTLLPCAYDSLH